MKKIDKWIRQRMLDELVCDRPLWVLREKAFKRLPSRDLKGNLKSN